MDNITEIKNYILFLKKECNLDITLHPYGEEHLISASELIMFNIHENSHCVYVKTFPQAHEHCVRRQKKIVQKCNSGSFCGTCYAGVQEYVYPILDKGSVVGFICVSGYKDANFGSYIERCSENFAIPIENLQKSVQCLKEKMPDKSYVDTLIAPLIRMLELAYINSVDTKTETDIVGKIKQYVYRHYTQDITLKEICELLSYSHSHISHLFKKTTGQSFREYLTAVRLQTAKSLLHHSNLSITEVAFSVGFSDSNYFSNVFKNYMGMSPRTYRNQHSE